METSIRMARMLIVLAFGLVLALLLFRTFAFHHRSGEPAQNAGTQDHP